MDTLASTRLVLISRVNELAKIVDITLTRKIELAMANAVTSSCRRVVGPMDADGVGVRARVTRIFLSH